MKWNVCAHLLIFGTGEGANIKRTTKTVSIHNCWLLCVVCCVWLTRSRFYLFSNHRHRTKKYDYADDDDDDSENGFAIIIPIRQYFFLLIFICVRTANGLSLSSLCVSTQNIAFSRRVFLQDFFLRWQTTQSLFALISFCWMVLAQWYDCCEYLCRATVGFGVVNSNRHVGLISLSVLLGFYFSWLCEAQITSLMQRKAPLRESFHMIQ